MLGWVFRSSKDSAYELVRLTRSRKICLSISLFPRYRNQTLTMSLKSYLNVSRYLKHFIVGRSLACQDLEVAVSDQGFLACERHGFSFCCQKRGQTCRVSWEYHQSWQCHEEEDDSFWYHVWSMWSPLQHQGIVHDHEAHGRMSCQFRFILGYESVQQSKYWTANQKLDNDAKPC